MSQKPGRRWGDVRTRDKLAMGAWAAVLCGIPVIAGLLTRSVAVIAITYCAMAVLSTLGLVVLVVSLTRRGRLDTLARNPPLPAVLRWTAGAEQLRSNQQGDSDCPAPPALCCDPDRCIQGDHPADYEKPRAEHEGQDYEEKPHSEHEGPDA